MIISLIIVFLSGGVSAQKLMIKNEDTLPFKMTQVIKVDTSYSGGKMTLSRDTFYNHPCETFIRRNGKIINYTNKNCQRVGKWVINNNDNTISKGYYNQDGDRVGVWKTYTEGGKLIREKEYVISRDHSYLVKEVKYEDGKKVVIKKTSWLERLFYIKKQIIIIFILGAFFIRIPINIFIIWREYGQGVRVWPFNATFDQGLEYNLRIVFTFWWSRLSSENKWIGWIINVLSIISLGSMVALFIWSLFTGKL